MACPTEPVQKRDPRYESVTRHPFDVGSAWVSAVHRFCGAKRDSWLMTSPETLLLWGHKYTRPILVLFFPTASHNSPVAYYSTVFSTYQSILLICSHSFPTNGPSTRLCEREVGNNQLLERSNDSTKAFRRSGGNSTKHILTFIPHAIWLDGGDWLMGVTVATAALPDYNASCASSFPLVCSSIRTY